MPVRRRASPPSKRAAYLDSPCPLAFAHQGFSGNGAGNSIAAFSAAVELGYQYLETDARATRDGVVLAFHDATLDRLTDGSGRIAALPWHELQRAKINGVEPLARLEDVLGTWPEIRLNIDVKDAATVEPLARVIERTRAHSRVCIASFSDRRRRAVLRRLSAPVASSAGREVTTAFRLGAGSQWLTDHALRDVDCLQVPERAGLLPVVTADTVAAAHRVGRQLHVWTVNDAQAMHRLLDLGVDGIITDRADVLREVLRSRGQWRNGSGCTPAA